MKKRWMAALLSAAVLVTTMTGCGRLNNSETVATMKGGEITAGVANFYARYQAGTDRDVLRIIHGR